MADYVADLQNPEYREVSYPSPSLPCLPTALTDLCLLQETENYISELEGENKVPAGKELVR